MRGERGGVQYHRDGLLLRAEFCHGLPEKIQHAAVAGILQPVAIASDAIDADAKTQIFDGARAQQGLPGIPPRAGPIGDI